ncbi:MAG: thioredoxin-dependent thiol peroxidase [Phycisphaeraceae bacterium]
MARSAKKTAKGARVRSAKPQAAGSAKPRAAGLVNAGRKAPAFKLVNQHGVTRQLKDFAGKWLVLYFYPKDDTPGCTTESCGFRDEVKQFEKRGAVIVGISPDNEKSHLKFATKHNLPFELLADAEQKMCSAYGVWQEKSMYGRTYMGVARTTYLINAKGKVAARWDKVKPAGHEAEVLMKIDEEKG